MRYHPPTSAPAPRADGVLPPTKRCGTSQLQIDRAICNGPTMDGGRDFTDSVPVTARATSYPDEGRRRHSSPKRAPSRRATRRPNVLVAPLVGIVGASPTRSCSLPAHDAAVRHGQRAFRCLHWRTLREPRNLSRRQNRAWHSPPASDAKAAVRPHHTAARVPIHRSCRQSGLSRQNAENLPTGCRRW